MTRATSPRARRRDPVARAAPPIRQRQRILAVDAGRGVAVLLMVAYHFCFDLNYFRLAHFDFHHGAFWLAARGSIVTLFLLLVGVSLHLASIGGLNRAAYLRRLAWLVTCAGMVSATSYVMFPSSWIYFGVLHFIALASVLGLLFTRLHYLNLLLGAAITAAGLTLNHPWFDHAQLNWIGFVTHKPITEDYVPFFPWFGVVLLGMFAGAVLTGRTGRPLRNWRGLPGGDLLGWLGRHSLAVYMLHQPLLLGALYLLTRLLAN